MSEVELLRGAAKTMRERALLATPGPWESDDSEIYGNPRALWVGETLKTADNERARAQTRNDSAHIASWHPEVALAVADWLDGEADLHAAIEQVGGEVPDGWTLRVTSSTLPQAVAVARAYLGSES